MFIIASVFMTYRIEVKWSSVVFHVQLFADDSFGTLSGQAVIIADI